MKKNIKKPIPKVYFTDVAFEVLEHGKTLPEKFKRLIRKFNLDKRVKDKTVAIKMHLGGGIGYTTIHPLFVRILVQELKDAGAKSIKAMDGYASAGLARGYTQEVLGCPVVSCFGETGKYCYKEKIGYKGLDEVLFSGEAVDSDFIVNLSHVKGHGNCGFGGAIKNFAMGIVPPPSRWKIHGLEGGLTFDKSKCKFCLKCFKACPNDAIKPDREKKLINIFFHNCTGCQHCVLACPEGAITLDKRRFGDFSEGMAIVTSKFLKKFKPEDIIYISFLMNISIYCDCWGFSTTSLVPDIGILGSEDIAAIDTASLDMIKTEDLIQKGLPKGRKLLDEGKHLFEKIHGKDPYLMINFLEEHYDCSTKYEIQEIK